MLKIIKRVKVTAVFAVQFLVQYFKSCRPIRIPVLNWSSQIVMANVMAQVFEEMGHIVELF